MNIRSKFLTGAALTVAALAFATSSAGADGLERRQQALLERIDREIERLTPLERAERSGREREGEGEEVVAKPTKLELGLAKRDAEKVEALRVLRTRAAAADDKDSLDVVEPVVQEVLTSVGAIPETLEL